METQSQKLERLLSMKRAGWANLPETGSILGLTIPAGHRSILVERATGCIILSDEGKPFTRPEQVQFQRANRYNRGLFRAHVNTFENHVTYMYLDCKGLVTVGLGHQIPTVEDAMGMKFYYRGTTNGADKADIKDAFNVVLNSGMACESHTKFEKLAKIDNNIKFDLDLDLNAIERLFDEDVNEFVRQLSRSEKFPDFETYPASAQLGMLDLIYNIGGKNFFGGFPVFQDALKLRNWIKVAEESHREEEINGEQNKTMKRRNEVVRDWFLDAIKDEPFFLNPDCPPKRLSMIAG